MLWTLQSIFLPKKLRNATFNRKEEAGMERIDRLYALLERSDVDEDTKAAVRGAIFKLEGR